MLAVTMAVTTKARTPQPLALQWVAGIISDTLAQNKNPGYPPGFFLAWRPVRPGGAATQFPGTYTSTRLRPPRLAA